MSCQSDTARPGPRHRAEISAVSPHIRFLKEGEATVQSILTMATSLVQGGVGRGCLPSTHLQDVKSMGEATESQTQTEPGKI